MPPLICRELSKLDRIRNLEESMGLFVIQSTNRSLLITPQNLIYSSVTHRISYNERGGLRYMGSALWYIRGFFGLTNNLYNMVIVPIISVIKNSAIQEKNTNQTKAGSVFTYKVKTVEINVMSHIIFTIKCE